MPPPNRFRWNAAASRYIDSRTGRFVPLLEIRRAIDFALDSENQQVRALAMNLREGRIGLEEWRVGMRTHVKDVQLYSAAAARGGWAQLTPEDYGRIGGLVGEQYRYLENFTRQISGGLPLDGRFQARTEMYMQAARRTYETTFMREMVEKHEVTEQRNILHRAEHCGECEDATAMGWMPVGTLPEIGDRQCGPNCRCTMEFR